MSTRMGSSCGSTRISVSTPRSAQNGIATLNWGEFQTGVTLQADGKILIWGGEGPQGGGDATIGRLNPDGSIDTTFGQGGSISAAFSNQVTGFVAVLVQPDGKIVGVGYTSGAGGNVGAAPATIQSRPAISRVAASTHRSPTAESRQFAISSDADDSMAGAVALPNGDIVFAGSADGLPVLAAILTASGQKTSDVTWANPANITYGTALGATQLDATASSTSGGTTVNLPGSFTYAPAAGKVLGAGSSERLSVSFTPTDTTDYADANATATINVLKATPTITWANPANIGNGTALAPPS